MKQHTPKEQRYWILQKLRQGYGGSMAIANSIFNELVADGLAQQQGQKEFELHLVGLSVRGYLRIYRAKDMPWYRGVPFLFADRSDTIMFAKILPAGLSVVEEAEHSELWADL